MTLGLAVLFSINLIAKQISLVLSFKRCDNVNSQGDEPMSKRENWKVNIVKSFSEILTNYGTGILAAISLST